MWRVRTDREIEQMAETGRTLSAAMRQALGLASPGIALAELRRRLQALLRDSGCEGPATDADGGVGLAVGAVAAGSSPDETVLQAGDLLTIDLYAQRDGWWADLARTVPIGSPTLADAQLLRIGRQALDRLLAAIRPGDRWSAVVRDLPEWLAKRGLRLVPNLRGHGIGRELHESPQFPWPSPGEQMPADIVLEPGLTFTVEPAVTAGSGALQTGPGGRLTAADGAAVVHFEETVAVTADGVRILTRPAASAAGKTGPDANVVLIGMPGAGKSTVGRELAARLGRRFVDLDEVIERGESRSLREIIEAIGFQGFLGLEARYAYDFDARGVVLSTGGSVPYRADAMEALCNGGTVVYLQVELEELSRRLSDLQQRGVVVEPGRTLAELWAERAPLYETWHDVKIATGALSAQQTARAIADRLGRGDAAD